MTTVVRCTELGRPAQDLAVNSLVAQKGLLCDLTATTLKVVDATMGRIVSDVIDTELLVVNDLTVLGDISFIPGGGSGGTTPFTFCADAPLEINAVTGCFAIQPGTSDVDTLVYNPVTTSWDIGPLPSTVLAGSITLTFGSGSATVNVDALDQVNITSGVNGNPPNNPGLDPIMSYVKVGNVVECSIQHVGSHTAALAPPALSQMVIKNLPFRGGVPFAGVPDVVRGVTGLNEYVDGFPGGASVQSIAGIVRNEISGALPAALMVQFSMATTAVTFGGVSQFRYLALQNTP
jgi:hypothetical protein